MGLGRVPAARPGRRHQYRPVRGRRHDPGLCRFGSLARPTESRERALLSTIATGTQMWVEVGPRFRDGIVWYQVSGLGSDSRYGWTDQSLYQKVSSGPPDNTPPQPGDSVVTTSAVNFRIGPTTSAAIIRLLASWDDGNGPGRPNIGQWLQLVSTPDRVRHRLVRGQLPAQDRQWRHDQPNADADVLRQRRTPSPTPPPGATFAVGDTVRSTTLGQLPIEPVALGRIAAAHCRRARPAPCWRDR